MSKIKFLLPPGIKLEVSILAISLDCLGCRFHHCLFQLAAILSRSEWFLGYLSRLELV